MNIQSLNIDLNAFAEPKTIDDLIALAHEIRSEFANIHAHMAGILGKRFDLQAA